jgi:hypothetical protein
MRKVKVYSCTARCFVSKLLFSELLMLAALFLKGIKIIRALGSKQWGLSIEGDSGCSLLQLGIQTWEIEILSDIYGSGTWFCLIWPKPMPWHFLTENGGMSYSPDCYKLSKSISSSIAEIMWNWPSTTKARQSFPIQSWLNRLGRSQWICKQLKWFVA